MSKSSEAKGVKSMCMLGDDVYKYHFVSQGKTTIPGIDDAEEFDATHEAFDILNFTNEERENIYKVSAAVMHMGEMKFAQKGRDEQAMQDETEEGDAAAKLLGVESELMYYNITKPKIKVGTEFVVKSQSVNQVSCTVLKVNWWMKIECPWQFQYDTYIPNLQCNYQVGAMAKSIFDRLFKFLVRKCNDTLDTKQKRQSFSGVLDIAGFEIFDVSS